LWRAAGIAGGGPSAGSRSQLLAIFGERVGVMSSGSARKDHKHGQEGDALAVELDADISSTSR
jgi:hypothetical protein